MTTSTISELMTGLGQHLGMPGLQLDTSGCCQLLFDQRWLVTVVHQGALGRMALHCPVASAHAVQALGAAALRAMLQANFMGRGTGRCQLAICTEGRACLLIELALVETDGPVLLQALEQLLNQAQTWAEWMDRAGLVAARPGPADTLAFAPLPHPVAARQRDWSNQRV